MALNFNNGGGAIKWAGRMSQLKDYSNLTLNGFTPTDVDFAYDVRGEVFIFGELKTKGAPLPMGQRRLLMALLQLCMSSGKSCLVIVAEHDTVASEAIDVGNLIITQSEHTDGDVIRSGAFVGHKVNKTCEDFLNDRT
jgi:hypothetical protein